MRLDESVCGLTGRRKSPSWNLAVWMLHLRVVLPSLAVLLFLFPSAVRADSVAGDIPGTGDVACLLALGPILMLPTARISITRLCSDMPIQKVHRMLSSHKVFSLVIPDSTPVG